jgi:hypothetical protein
MKVRTGVKAGIEPGCPCGGSLDSKVHYTRPR